MKKYNQGMIAFTMIFLLSFAGIFFCFHHTKKEQDFLYRVEINRITTSFLSYAKTHDLPEKKIWIVPKSVYKTVAYQEVRRVVYLPSKAENQKEQVSYFYTSRNKYQMEIVPVLLNNEIKGYLRFDYQFMQKDTTRSDIWMFIALFFYILAIGTMFWVRQMIVKPFFSFSNIPYELARGNLELHVKESKNRYFGKFLWGIEMLRDSIDDQKIKQLRLEKEKKRMLLSISHDIKTPLHTINLYAKALEEDIYKSKEQQRIVAEKMQEKVKEINAFILEIMRAQTEDILNIEVDMQEFYLLDLTKKIKNSYVEKSKLKNVMFVLEQTDNQLLKGDLERLHEAIGNIIENAYKYGDGKVIKIFFTTEENYLLLHIFNSGIPMEEMEMSHIFESFYRGSNVKENQGNGLGLYICSEILKKMMGSIYALKKDDGMEFVLVVLLA